MRTVDDPPYNKQHIILIISALFEYREKLEHLDKLTHSFHHYHKEDNKIKVADDIQDHRKRLTQLSQPFVLPAIKFCLFHSIFRDMRITFYCEPVEIIDRFFFVIYPDTLRCFDGPGTLPSLKVRGPSFSRVPL